MIRRQEIVKNLDAYCDSHPGLHYKIDYERALFYTLKPDPESYLCQEIIQFELRLNEIEIKERT